MRRRHRSIVLRVDCVSELVQISVESAQETHGGVPADATLTTLNPAHERRVCIEAFGELLLREPGPAAQLAQSPAENELIVFGRSSAGGLVHGGNARVVARHIPEPFWSDCARLRSSIKSAGAPLTRPPAWHRKRELPARQTPYRDGQGALLAKNRLPGPPTQHLEEPKMTDEQQEQRGWMDEVQVERAIVLQVLRDDHPERWTRAELEAEVSDFAPVTVNEALVRLEAEGVVILDGENVEASRCARRMDALELVSI